MNKCIKHKICANYPIECDLCCANSNMFDNYPLFTTRKKTPFDNFLIISNYDTGVGFSAMVDGEEIEGEACYQLKHDYNEMKTEDFVQKYMLVYNRNIIICDNGCIEIYGR